MFYLVFKFICFVFTLLDLILITIVALFCAYLPSFINKYFMNRLLRGWCWCFIHLIGRKPHIHQKYTRPLPKQYILIANHPSGYDLLMLNAIFPVYPLAQQGVAKWFIIGKIVKASGAVFVERSHKKSRSNAKKACVEQLGLGKNVLVYPEGGCFGKHLRDFKYGAFDISISTGIPILPVYLLYEAENAFEWGDYGLLHHIFNLLTATNKNAHCYIFDPIYPEPFNTPESYAKYVHNKYEKWEHKYRL